MLFKMYTTLKYNIRYIILQYNFIQTSTYQGIIKNEIILLNLYNLDYITATLQFIGPTNSIKINYITLNKKT